MFATLIWSALALAAANFPTATKLTTSDGVTLAAAYGQPTKASKNGVIFVHMSGRAKEDWAPVADACWRAGAWVVTVDLRGMGANVPAGTAAPALTAADYLKMTEDVKAAVGFLKSKGATQLAVVGAELGANLAINVAADEPAIVDAVLLSPGMDYKGVIATDAVKRYGSRALLMVASADDPYGMQSVNRLATLAGAPPKIQMFETAGKGTRMLNKQPELEGIIAGWVATHWSASAVPTSAGTGITVKPTETVIETNGPTQPTVGP